MYEYKVYKNNKIHNIDNKIVTFYYGDEYKNNTNIYQKVSNIVKFNEIQLWWY